MSNEASVILGQISPTLGSLAAHPGATIGKPKGADTHTRALGKALRRLLKNSAGYPVPNDARMNQRNGDPSVPADATQADTFDSWLRDEQAADEIGSQSAAQERLNQNLASLLASCGVVPRAVVAKIPTRKAAPIVKPIVPLQPGDHVVHAASGVECVVKKALGSGRGQVALCDYGGNDLAWHLALELSTT